MLYNRWPLSTAWFRHCSRLYWSGSISLPHKLLVFVSYPFSSAAVMNRQSGVSHRLPPTALEAHSHRKMPGNWITNTSCTVIREWVWIRHDHMPFIIYRSISWAPPPTPWASYITMPTTSTTWHRRVKCYWQLDRIGKNPAFITLSYQISAAYQKKWTESKPEALSTLKVSGRATRVNQAQTPKTHHRRIVYATLFLMAPDFFWIHEKVWFYRHHWGESPDGLWYTSWWSIAGMLSWSTASPLVAPAIGIRPSVLHELV